MQGENLHITTDFEEWKTASLKQQPKVEPDKLIYPDEIKDMVAGYMLHAVGSANGTMLMTTEYHTPTVQDAFAYITNMSADFDVYVYQILWRHAQVDGYTINSIIIKFSTTDKHNE